MRRVLAGLGCSTCGCGCRRFLSDWPDPFTRLLTRLGSVMCDRFDFGHRLDFFGKAGAPLVPTRPAGAGALAGLPPAAGGGSNRDESTKNFRLDRSKFKNAQGRILPRAASAAITCSTVDFAVSRVSIKIQPSSTRHRCAAGGRTSRCSDRSSRSRSLAAAPGYTG